MNQNDIEQYIKTLASGEKKLDGMEGTILNKLRQTEQRMSQLQQAAQQARVQLEQAKAEINAIQGEARGYVDLLVGAENGRRGFVEEAEKMAVEVERNNSNGAPKLKAVSTDKQATPAPTE